MSDPNGTSTENWGDVLDCTERFMQRAEIAEKLRESKEKQKKILDQYKKKAKDPKAPPPDSEVLVTKEMLVAIVAGIDQNMKLFATSLDESARMHNKLAQAHNELVRSCESMDKQGRILFDDSDNKTNTINLHVKILRRIMETMQCMSDDLQDHHISLNRTEKFLQRCADEDKKNEQTPTT